MLSLRPQQDEPGSDTMGELNAEDFPCQAGITRREGNREADSINKGRRREKKTGITGPHTTGRGAVWKTVASERR